MTGHKHIIEMRLEGLKPSMVFFQGEDAPTAWEDNPNDWEQYPRVYIPDSDHVALLDLRFVIGLDIHLVASTLQRMVEIRAALRRAGASLIVAAVYDNELSSVTYIDDGQGGVWQP